MLTCSVASASSLSYGIEIARLQSVNEQKARTDLLVSFVSMSKSVLEISFASYIIPNIFMCQPYAAYGGGNNLFCLFPV